MNVSDKDGAATSPSQTRGFDALAALPMFSNRPNAMTQVLVHQLS